MGEKYFWMDDKNTKFNFGIFSFCEMCFPLRRGCFNDYKAFILYVESSILGSSSHRDHTHRERMFGCFTFAKLGSFVNQNYFLFLHYSIFRCSGKTKPLFFEMAFLYCFNTA